MKRQITDENLERLLDARGNLTMYSFERSAWERARELALETAASHYRRHEDREANVLRVFAAECDKMARGRAALADEWRVKADAVQREVLPWESE